MSLSKLTENLNNHQSLPDKPALTADELKILFDKAPNDIKEYINTVLTREIDSVIQTIQSEKIDTNKIINDLTTGGANNVASAELAKTLANNKADTTYVNTELGKKANSSHTHTKSQITDFAHNHDDRYYTVSEIDSKLKGKANSSHTHTTSQITGLKSGATTTITSGTANPSGGSNGDVYIQYFT